jgi:hypothetical protein
MRLRERLGDPLRLEKNQSISGLPYRGPRAAHAITASLTPRTVKHWMGHKSFETTMGYLAPAIDV